jgi:heat shock protein HslJ
MKKLIISVVAIALLTGLFSYQVLAQEPVECEAEYTVKAGDWLSKIAQKYYGDATAYEQIVVASNARSDDDYADISSPNSIEPGLYLCLPPAPMVAQQPAPASSPQLVGPIWQWQQTQMNNGDLFTPDTPANYTVQFMADSAAAIQADCNTVRATYTITDNRVSLTKAPSTLVACPEGSLGDQFVSNLSNTTLFFFQDGNLFIDLKFDSGTMSFSPISSELAGSNWLVTAYNNGREAVVGPLADTELTADFGVDGTLSGSAGCNSYSAGYEASGNNISVGQAAVTMMFCEEPAGVMEQEQEFLAALSTAATYEITGNAMQMRTADDALAAMFVRAAAPTTAPAPAAPEPAAPEPAAPEPTAPEPTVAEPTLADKMMTEITLVQHSFNPETNNTSFICASSGQGLNGVAPDAAGARFVGPNAGDFDLWGIVGLFQVDPDGTMTFVPERIGGKFVNPDGFEFRRISLDRTLNYFATGEGRWTGDFGLPGRIEKCDPTNQ